MRSKIYYTILMITLIALPLFSQGVGNLQYINDLGNKKIATNGDAVKFFMMAMDKTPGAFKTDVSKLKKLGVLRSTDIDEKSPLRRGVIANMVVRHLKLRDSLLYIIFGTDRYAYRVCAARRIMDYDGSEWDIISGEELIEIMSNVTGK
ncbi:hypothetical protein ACFL20_11860 [Spirochaetota bacterium]